MLAAGRGFNLYGDWEMDLIGSITLDAKPKLTTEQVAEIRRRGETETRASLAREFGVDPITILNVIRKRTYAEI